MTGPHGRGAATKEVEAARVGRGGERRRGDPGELLYHLPEIGGVGGEDGGGGSPRRPGPLPGSLPHVGLVLMIRNRIRRCNNPVVSSISVMKGL